MEVIIQRRTSSCGDKYTCMVNKKGFVKTLEAVIGILIVFGFVVLLTPLSQEQQPDVPFTIKDAQQFVLEEIALNDVFRGCITGAAVNGACAKGCLEDVNTFIQENTPVGYVHGCEVCERAVSCTSATLPVDKSIYTDSVFISADDAKILRVYFWEQ